MALNPKKISLLKKINAGLKDSLKSCSICPRRCCIDRSSGELGYCRAGYNARIYSYYSHTGEEPAISGTKGSGTIFFSHCNMKCRYCQNYRFSQLDKGEEVSQERLSAIMLELQKLGCHNINLVTPTHFLPQILRALELAAEKGLSIPIVYNTSGYELPEMITLLNGIVDIYLPDMRYSDNIMAGRYSDAVNYVDFNRRSVIQMQAQVGDLVLDEKGIAKNGLIIRLLALPSGISGTIDSLRFIKDNVSPNAYLSIMSQYYPTYKACDYNEISRPVTNHEYQNIVDEARVLGLNNGWIQQISSSGGTDYLGTNIKPKA